MRSSTLNSTREFSTTRRSSHYVNKENSNNQPVTYSTKLQEVLDSLLVSPPRRTSDLSAYR